MTATNDRLVPEIGSVSWGTMRAEDLIPAFLMTLSVYAPAKAQEFQAEIDSRQHEFEGEYGEDWFAMYAQSDGAIGLLSELFNALDRIAPDGAYFGSHPGNGADYGFWPSEDAEEEEEEEEDTVCCDQCEALMINGVFCHEHGCPNRGKRYSAETQEWERIYTCRECGSSYTDEADFQNCCRFVSDEEIEEAVN